MQLIGETRVPIPATKEHPERVDYEYERKGTASIFMFAEPLRASGKRRPDGLHPQAREELLNVAECELSCMTSQCLSDRRIGDLATLQSEIVRGQPAPSTRSNGPSIGNSRSTKHGLN